MVIFDDEFIRGYKFITGKINHLMKDILAMLSVPKKF